MRAPFSGGNDKDRAVTELDDVRKAERLWIDAGVLDDVLTRSARTKGSVQSGDLWGAAPAVGGRK